MTVLALIPSFAYPYARKELSIYKEVQNEYLKNFVQEKKETILYNPQTEENNKQEPNKLIIEKLSNYTKHDLVTSMFVHHGTLHKHNDIIDPIFIHEMELLYGKENTQKHLLGHLISADNLSIFGRIGFASILINPTSNISELCHRQTVVATFNDILQDKYLSQDLTASFEKIRHAQTKTIHYWHTECEINKKLLKRIYYSSLLGKYANSFNKSTVALEALTRIRTLLGTTLILSPIIFYTGLNTVKVYEKKNGEISKAKAIYEGFKKVPGQIATLNPFTKISKNYSLKTLTLLYSCCIVGSHAYATKKIFDDAQLNTCITNHIHKRLIAVATVVQEARTLYKLLQGYEATATMPVVQQLATFFEKNSKRSSNLSHLLNMLQTNTFKGEPSFFSLTGRVLAAHTLMNEVKDELIPLFEAIGHIEAYLTTAKFFTKHEKLDSKFCFAEFVEAESPSVTMKNFWNPFIAPKVVVANDAVFNSLTMGQNVILTGPNTSVKSMIIKGISLNILLAQTFGICAAQHVRLTPFSILNCNLNTDDITTGSALFHAKKRARALLNDVQSLPQKQFCFTVMDEVFNRANTKDESEASYKFLDQLDQYSNLILVINTHFDKLTELDKTGNFRNMHVETHLDENGKLISTLKLQPGIFRNSKNNILHTILEKEGIFTPKSAAA